MTLAFYRDGKLMKDTLLLHASPILVVDRYLGMALMNLNKVVADQLGLDSPQGHW